MKQNTESITESIFTHFPPSNTIRYANSESRSYLKSLFSTLVKKKVLAYRDQLQSGAATLGIGTTLLITVYLFLAQLAEHGWQ